MENGYIKLSRDALELVEKDPDVFILMTQIALRAKRRVTTFDDGKTAIGQALIGDYRSIGLTEKRYRLAKQRAEQKYQIATFKGTNRGTVATLLNSKLYDINIHEERQAEGRTKGEPRATKEEVKKKEIIQEKDIPIGISKKKPTKPTFIFKDPDLTSDQIATVQAQFSNLDVAIMYASCCDHFKAKGEQKCDWMATLRNWCRNELKWRGSSTKITPFKQEVDRRREDEFGNKETRYQSYPALF